MSATKKSTTRKMKKHVYAVRIGNQVKRVRSRRFMLAFTGERLMDGKPYEGHIVNPVTRKPVNPASAKGKARFIGADQTQALDG
jgi:hypothetical protein